MVHRDPETGQYVSDSGDMVEYADHEVQGINFSIVDDGSGTSPVEDRIQIEPVMERGIDSDELAELVGFFRTATLVPKADQDQTSGDAVSAEASLGINTNARSEDIKDASSQATLYEEPDTPPQFRLGEVDDPGTLDVVQIAGLTGSTQGTTAERFMNFRELTGSGPYIDRTDDLTVAAELSQNASDFQRYEVSYVLYWSVEEMPEGRASFARP